MFHSVEIISGVHKSCFLVDLRSFLPLFFVCTENKGAFTVTKKLQLLIPVALFPIHYHKFLRDFRDEPFFSLHLFTSKQYSILVQQV